MRFVAGRRARARRGGGGGEGSFPCDLGFVEEAVAAGSLSGEDFDLVVDCCGDPQAVEDALNRTGKGAVVVLFACPPASVRIRCRLAAPRPIVTLWLLKMPFVQLNDQKRYYLRPIFFYLFTYYD